MTVAQMEPVDYVDTFIACAKDCPATEGTVPPGKESVAARTWLLVSKHPYRFTSGDVIFTVYADRTGIRRSDRPAARGQFYASGRACLRASDLGRRYGWGIHANSAGRIALVGVETEEYATFVSGAATTKSGQPVKVITSMRRSRPR